MIISTVTVGVPLLVYNQNYTTRQSFVMSTTMKNGHSLQGTSRSQVTD